MPETTEKSKRGGRAPVSAYDQAIKYLGLRSHTEFELKTKLLRKKYSGKEIEDVLAQLRSQKYINDEDFARMFAQNLVKYKTFGFYGIKNKLKMRGISDRMSEEILNDELSVEDERKIARRALGKTRSGEKIKLMQALQRKGFRGQVISSEVSEFLDE